MKKMYIFLLAAGLLLLMILYWLWNSSRMQIYLSKRQLPEAYAAYPLLLEVNAFGGYELEHHSFGAAPANEFRIDEIVLDPRQHLLLVSTWENMPYRESPHEKAEMRNMFWKINMKGKIVDSYQREDIYQEDWGSGYFLHQDYYLNWLLTGDTSRHAYAQIINKRLGTPKEELHRQIDSLKEKAEVIVSDHRFVEEVDHAVTLRWFKVGEDWFLVYENADQPLEERYGGRGENDIDKPNNRLRPVHYVTAYKYTLGPESGDYDWANRQNSVHVAYYLKEQYRPGSGPFSLGIHGTRVPSWEGTAYVHLLYEGDTLGFKVPFVEADQEERYYKLNLEFAVLPQEEEAFALASSTKTKPADLALLLDKSKWGIGRGMYVITRKEE